MAFKAFDCPKCRQRLQLSTTKQLAPRLKIRYYLCTNLFCDAKTWRSFEELEEDPAVIQPDPVKVQNSAENCRLTG